MKVSSGTCIRRLTSVAGGAILFTSSFVEEAVTLTIFGVSLIAIGAVAFLSHSILSRKGTNKKILTLTSITRLCAGGAGTALTD